MFVGYLSITIFKTLCNCHFGKIPLAKVILLLPTEYTRKIKNEKTNDDQDSKHCISPDLRIHTCVSA